MQMAIAIPVTGQSPHAPFNRGVNLTNWFQVSSARRIQFGRYTREDLADIKSLGVDVIRLPINLHFMTSGAPDYTLDPLFLNLLDQVVDWTEDLGIHLILDNHTFDPSENTDPGVGTILLKVWSQMALHFRDRSDLVYYEVLNEPHGIGDALWNNIQQSVIDEIRKTDTAHYIVIGPASWNSYNNLSAMPEYNDSKLIYTFHFYDPFLFTHQGASWVDPSMVPIANVPFPYDAAPLPSMPAQFEGTWVGSLFSNYSTDGTEAKVKELIDIAIQFGQERGVPIFCGEFGVYQRNSQEPYRVAWYQLVREYLEQNGVAWTTWDYHGGFGLFEKNGNDLFDHDLNVPLLNALGLNVPEQTQFQIMPDTAGFMLYDDYLDQSIREASYTDGILDYYSSDSPLYGKYCIHWTGASQYEAIVFDFVPNRDLGQLMAEDYALDFMVKGDDGNITFDMRFVDTGSDNPYDVPWRMGTTINGSVVGFDYRWHHLHIPLKNLVEKGGWDGVWHDPQGEFDWTKIDQFEIVPEAAALGDATLFFDNIHITNMDTATVQRPTSVYPSQPRSRRSGNSHLITVYPNPTTGPVYFSFPTGSENPTVQIHLYDLQGRQVLSRKVPARQPLLLKSLPDGIYILQIAGDREPPYFSRIILRTH